MFDMEYSEKFQANRIRKRKISATNMRIAFYNDRFYKNFKTGYRSTIFKYPDRFGAYSSALDLRKSFLVLQNGYFMSRRGINV